MKEIYVKCPLCGKDDYVVVWDKGVRERDDVLFSVVMRDEGEIVNGRNVMCKQCGMVYINPRLDDASLAEFYETQYREIYGTNVDANVASEAEHAMAAVDVLSRIGLNPNGKRFLDVGCSSGQLVKALSQHADAEGVEANTKFADMGKTEGLVIHNVNFLDFNPIKKYDVITSMNTLEHMPDPMSVLKKMRSMLAPEGIVLLSVPNLWNSFVTRTVDAFLSNAHLHNFSPKTLGLMMRTVGIAPVFIETRLEEIGEKIYIIGVMKEPLVINYENYDPQCELTIEYLNAINKIAIDKVKLVADGKI